MADRTDFLRAFVLLLSDFALFVGFYLSFYFILPCGVYRGVPGYKHFIPSMNTNNLFKQLKGWNAESMTGNTLVNHIVHANDLDQLHVYTVCSSSGLIMISVSVRK